MSPTRRDVLRMMAGVVAAAGFGVPRTVDRAAAAPMGPLDPPEFDGELRVDTAALAAAADDFGHLVRRTPHGVLVPGSIRDLTTVVTWAADRGRQVAAQGRHHSVYGRGQVADGVVVDLSSWRTVAPVEGDRVDVAVGATWREVLAATLPHGLTPPVLTDYLDLSVGGTLVVGGVGATTARHGVQSDNVLELEVVTGRGAHVVCSPDCEAALFDAVRAGLGQVAIVVRATIALVPAAHQARRFLLSYPDLRSLLDDQRLLDADGRFDTVQGAVVPGPTGWSYRLDAAAFSADGEAPDDGALLAGLSDERPEAEISSSPYLAHVDRLAALERLLRGNGQWFHPHPWLTTFVGDEQVEAVVGAELARLTPADLGTFGQVVLSPIRRDAVTSPLLQLPDDDRCFTFNLIRIPTTDDATEADRMVQANRAIYERVRDAGGTLYPVSAFPMSTEDWRHHFGPTWDQLRRAKRLHDPAGVLTPGYDVIPG